MTDKAQKHRKFRLSSVLKRRQNEPTSSDSTGAEYSKPRSSAVSDYGDRQRAIERYVEAAQLLKQVIGESEAYQWGSFDLPNLSNKPEDFNDSQFQEQINEVLMARRTIVADQKTWGKCREAILSIFTALSPFAKNFLTVATNAQSVRTFPFLLLILLRYRC